MNKIVLTTVDTASSCRSVGVSSSLSQTMDSFDIHGSAHVERLILILEQVSRNITNISPNQLHYDIFYEIIHTP